MYWKRKSKTYTHKPKVAPETIALIRQMASENRLWGAERIRGELLKLGVQRFKVVDNSEHLSQSLDSMVESPYPCCSWKLSQLPMSNSEDDDGASCVRIAARGLSPALSGETRAC